MSAAEFSSQEDLHKYLDNIASGYGDSYAAALWGKGVRYSAELANADKEDLLEYGVSNKIHASNIKASAASTGGKLFPSQVQVYRKLAVVVCVRGSQRCCARLRSVSSRVR